MKIMCTYLRYPARFDRLARENDSCRHFCRHVQNPGRGRVRSTQKAFADLSIAASSVACKATDDVTLPRLSSEAVRSSVARRRKVF
jgi:hypothetical protein